MIRCTKGDNIHKLKGFIIKIYKSVDERRHHSIAMHNGGLSYSQKAKYYGKNTVGAVPFLFLTEKYATARQHAFLTSIVKCERERLQALSKICNENK